MGASERAPPPSFHTTPVGGRSAPTYDLMCSSPLIRRIFSGTFRPRSRDLTTRPTRASPGVSQLLQETNPSTNIYLLIKTLSVIRQRTDASRKRLSLIGLDDEIQSFITW
ncbi:hypothetical protein AVEN_273003-1 [Araneus ventricosus]|uniref:Uncharacterized protein n=1 Tax=Araneus ventricosus TaxID=182803 RepID=A0A4Y2EZR7_ARAVE|nr:hypothetical protein AVEN_273003-1 [Araneus ventricosus]